MTLREDPLPKKEDRQGEFWNLSDASKKQVDEEQKLSAVSTAELIYFTTTMST